MPITHYSPGDVIRWLLIDLGLGTAPSLGQAWPVFAEGEPPEPDDCLTVYTTDGVDSGRTQVDGEQNGTDGFQIRIRCVRHPEGFDKGELIKNALNSPTNCFRRTIRVGGVGGPEYLVHAVDRLGNVIPIGKESPDSRRNLFTINGQLMQDRL